MCVCVCDQNFRHRVSTTCTINQFDFVVRISSKKVLRIYEILGAVKYQFSSMLKINRLCELKMRNAFSLVLVLTFYVFTSILIIHSLSLSPN